MKGLYLLPFFIFVFFPIFPQTILENSKLKFVGSKDLNEKNIASPQKTKILSTPKDELKTENEG